LSQKDLSRIHQRACGRTAALLVAISWQGLVKRFRLTSEQPLSTGTVIGYRSIHWEPPHPNREPFSQDHGTVKHTAGKREKRCHTFTLLQHSVPRLPQSLEPRPSPFTLRPSFSPPKVCQPCSSHQKLGGVERPPEPISLSRSLQSSTFWGTLLRFLHLFAHPLLHASTQHDSLPHSLYRCRRNNSPCLCLDIGNTGNWHLFASVIENHGVQPVLVNKGVCTPFRRVSIAILDYCLCPTLSRVFSIPRRRRGGNSHPYLLFCACPPSIVIELTPF